MIGFYVTLRRAKKTAYLLGPFVCHDRCKAAVDEAFKCAEEIDPFVWFDAYGTASITGDKLPAGVLNGRLPHLLENVSA